MVAEKTITICGRDISLRYCAAAETSYERLTGKNSTDLWAKNKTPTEDELISLAIGTIVAAYARRGCQPPITSDDIIYEASPQELISLFTAVIELRSQWYSVPSVVPESEHANNDDEKKNV